MSHIEYLPGLEVGDKIPVEEKLPRPETYLPVLKQALSKQAGRLNGEYGEFVNVLGQIKISGPETDTDRQAVYMREAEWAQAEEKTLGAWLAAREKNPANITEIALDLLFDKILGDQFVVVRASNYDDYENGADQLIIDKETGAVVCGIDDVIDNLGAQSDKLKDKKIGRKMAAGGAQIKYGATIQNGKLIRASLSNLPIFYFSLDNKALNSLLAGLSAGTAGPGPAEQAVFDQLISSLAEQAHNFSQDRRLDGRLQANLLKFQPSLDKMLAKTATPARKQVA
ncbi:MAG: hypothetical protein WC453_03335 [Patescibacteria group bacterium]